MNILKSAIDLEKKARVFKRYQALHLFFSGKTGKEVDAIVDIIKTCNVCCGQAFL